MPSEKLNMKTELWHGGTLDFVHSRFDVFIKNSWNISFFAWFFPIINFELLENINKRMLPHWKTITIIVIIQANLIYCTWLNTNSKSIICCTFAYIICFITKKAWQIIYAINRICLSSKTIMLQFQNKKKITKAKIKLINTTLYDFEQWYKISLCHQDMILQHNIIFTQRFTAIAINLWLHHSKS